MTGSPVFGCASVAFWAIVLAVELFLNAFLECVGLESYKAACKAQTHHQAIVVLVAAIVIYAAALVWALRRARDAG